MRSKTRSVFRFNEGERTNPPCYGGRVGLNATQAVITLRSCHVSEKSILEIAGDEALNLLGKAEFRTVLAVQKLRNHREAQFNPTLEPLEPEPFDQYS